MARFEKEPAKKPAASAEKKLSKENLEVAAYYRWLKRGGGHGEDMKDWVEAEKDLKKK